MTKYSNKEKSSNSFLFKNKSDQDLILYNDNYNEFNFVIDSLIKVCGHYKEQATQCTVIAHLKGKSKVKKGAYSELKSMKKGLREKGLNANIE